MNKTKILLIFSALLVFSSVAYIGFSAIKHKIFENEINSIFVAGTPRSTIEEKLSKYKNLIISKEYGLGTGNYDFSKYAKETNSEGYKVSYFFLDNLNAESSKQTGTVYVGIYDKNNSLEHTPVSHRITQIKGQGVIERMIINSNKK